jgi:uncharacterized Zn-finger protein
MDSNPRLADVPKTREVSQADLPLSCPMPDMELWSAHPRVFLPIEKTGDATCPYCSAHYTLKK